MPVVLVTGGAKRVGKAIIQKFTGAGYKCLVHANRSEDDAKQLCRSIRDFGGVADYFLHEIKDPDVASDVMLDACWDFYGELPMSSNLSAASYDIDPLGVPLQSITASQLSLNFLFPSAYCAALARRIPSEPKRVDRSVTLFTDYKVSKVNGDMFAYSLSKHALEGVIPYLTVAFARQIRVNAIAPGPTLSAHGLTQEELDAIVMSSNISGQKPLVEDIASTALFLASTPSLYGQHIFVDAAARFEMGAREFGVKK